MMTTKTTTTMMFRFCDISTDSESIIIINIEINFA